MSAKLEALHAILRPEQISKTYQDRIQYGNDWLKQWQGEAQAVLFPANSEQLSKIVQWAIKYNIWLVPSGGRTGLSGGASATQKEVVVSFDKMNRIVEFSPEELCVCVEAGCVTQDLQEFAKSKGLFFPIYFAAQGSSQIGGNIATNAGGMHVLRYGTIRRHVLGLEVVTGKGEILKLGHGLVKNALGYSLKDLFIGSEGTLGFVTKALLSLVPPPNNPKVFLMALDSYASLLTLLKEFKTKVNPLAFEFFTNKALHYVLSHGGLDAPFSDTFPFYVLLEIEDKDSSSSLLVFENLLTKNLIKDGIVSSSEDQARKLWALRENISEAISSFYPYKNDISIRISKMENFLQDLNDLLKKHYPDFENIVFGHLGDGNLHINILKPEKWDKKDFISCLENLNTILFQVVKKYQGAISAEHGVGLLKKPYLSYSCSMGEIHLMKGIKQVFDPHHILNPGKIF